MGKYQLLLRGWFLKRLRTIRRKESTTGATRWIPLFPMSWKREREFMHERPSGVDLISLRRLASDCLTFSQESSWREYTRTSPWTSYESFEGQRATADTCTASISRRNMRNMVGTRSTTVRRIRMEQKSENKVNNGNAGKWNRERKFGDFDTVS